jgi:tRNA G46 methylase TrmB
MLSTIKLKLAEQAQSPNGLFGRHIISRIFNKKNRDMEQFGLEQMNPVDHDHIHEIGFGNGRLISELASTVKNGKVCGITPPGP